MWLTLLFTVLMLAGCAGFGQDQPTELDPQELARQEGMKNLAAMKEMMANWPPLQPPSPVPDRMPESTQSIESDAPRINEPEKRIELPALFSIPKREPPQSQPVQMRPFISNPPNYTPDSRLLNPPLIPPYTFFAPTGSAYPGAIRCTPDYLGGSRCSVTP